MASRSMASLNGMLQVAGRIRTEVAYGSRDVLVRDVPEGQDVLGESAFRPAGQFSCELDLKEGMSYTVRAAFFHGVRQAGVRQAKGDQANADDYRMDVYASAGDAEPLLPQFTVPEPAAAYLPTGQLADYGEDELLGELARRLRSRA